MKNFSSVFALLGCALSLSAAPPIILRDGSFSYGGIQVQLAWFAEDWRMTGQNWQTVKPINGYPVCQPEMFELEGSLNLLNKAGSVKLQETIRLRVDHMQYQATLSGAKEIGCRAVSLILSLPVRLFGGKALLADAQSVELNKKDPKAGYPLLKKLSKLSIPMPDGSTMTLTGEFNCFIQDERRYQGDTYSLRIAGTRVANRENNYSWNLRFYGISTGVTASTKAPKTTPVDISKVVNMGWRDDIPGDQKGGWSDQGENDVRDIVPGRQILADVMFDLIDPAKNDGKSCMVFAGPDREYMLKRAVINNVNLKGERLYLLHGLGWAPDDIRPVGKIKIEYIDGSIQEFIVRSNKDVGNWWFRSRMENALVAWRGKNPQSDTSLYLSGFDLETGKVIKAITLTPTGSGVWMVAALSIGDTSAILKPPVRQQITANKDWRAIDTKLEIVKNSILDFSDLNHRPAGKFGEVIAVGDHFAFRDKPEKAVRFFGTNLCWSANNLLSHEEAEKLSVRLAALGYNSLRIHHYDDALVYNAKRKLIFDEKKLDCLDYLIYQLKLQGIYTTIDLFTTRVPAQEDVPEVRIRDMHDFRAALPLVPAVQQNFKEFARKLLTHRNAYTGIEWRNEPAIATICIVNENLLPAPWKKHPQLPALYRKAFAEWCQKKGIAFPEEFDDSPYFSHFLLDLQQKMYANFKDFLRNELGVRALLTDNNNGFFISQAAERSMLDYVDLHAYWEHAFFIENPWKLPHYYPQESVIKKEAFVPRCSMPARIVGKPVIMTEFDYCFPNKQRGEGGLVIGAYAGFQNWSGLYRFAYSHYYEALFKQAPCDLFDTVRDPLNQFADRLAALMFRRFDVTPSRQTIPFLFTREDSAGNSRFPENYTLLGLLTGIGSLDSYRASLGKNAPGVAVTTSPAKKVAGVETIAADSNLWNTLAGKGLIRIPKNGIYHADNGQITLDSIRGTLKVITPRTEGFVLPPGAMGEGKFLTAANGNTFVTCALTTPDYSLLDDGNRLLLFVLTDVLNNKITFRDAEHTILESYGTLPLLQRNGSLDISVKKGMEKRLQVYPVDMAGNRLATVPVILKNGAWSFVFTNAIPGKQAIFCYELVRNY